MRGKGGKVKLNGATTVAVCNRGESEGFLGKAPQPAVLSSSSAAHHLHKLLEVDLSIPVGVHHLHQILRPNG